MYNEVSTRRDTLHELYIYGAELEQQYGFPVLQPVYAEPTESVSFREMQKVVDPKGKVVHFYIDDCWFEKLWTNADRYIEQLRCFPCVIMPDFSVFDYMPWSMQLWNRYRSMALAYYMSQHGIKVIPSLGVLPNHIWTLVGLPQHSTVAVSTNGRIKKPKERKQFVNELNRQIEIIKPKNLIMIGFVPEEWDEPVPTIYLESESQKEYIRRLNKDDGMGGTRSIRIYKKTRG